MTIAAQVHLFSRGDISSFSCSPLSSLSLPAPPIAAVVTAAAVAAPVSSNGAIGGGDGGSSGGGECTSSSAQGETKGVTISEV